MKTIDKNFSRREAAMFSINVDYFIRYNERNAIRSRWHNDFVSWLSKYSE